MIHHRKTILDTLPNSGVDRKTARALKRARKYRLLTLAVEDAADEKGQILTRAQVRARVEKTMAARNRARRKRLEKTAD